MPAKKPKADGEEEIDEDAVVAAITDVDEVADEDESDSEWTDKVDDPDEDF